LSLQSKLTPYDISVKDGAYFFTTKQNTIYKISISDQSNLIEDNIYDLSIFSISLYPESIKGDKLVSDYRCK